MISFLDLYFEKENNAIV